MDSLDANTTEDYWRAMEVIEAQEMLRQITIACSPHMKQTKLSKLHRDLHRKAFPATYDAAPIGPQELAKILGAGRIRPNGK